MQGLITGHPVFYLATPGLAKANTGQLQAPTMSIPSPPPPTHPRKGYQDGSVTTLPWPALSPAG